MSYEIAEKINSEQRGSRFVRADLHIHTPASNDWDEKNPEPQFKSSRINAEDIVNAALNKGLELIAITDHNSVEWCDRVIEAAQGTSLTVLPGFELSVDPGIHILALFSADKPTKDLRELLVKLGIPSAQFGCSDAFTDSSLTDKDANYKVINILRKAGALVIPAHIDLDSGLLGRLRGGTASEHFLQNSGCRILEVAGEAVPELVANQLKTNPRLFALIRNSDAHRLDKIGSRFTWFKLDSLSLEGLRQVGLEPQSRIKLNDDLPDKKANILGFCSDGGIFKDQVFTFNPDLNCLIGGRGAGKSAILDYLRFVLGSEPEAEDLREKYYKRLFDLIGHSTSVHVLVEYGNGEHWLFHRKLDIGLSTSRGRTTYKLNSPKAIAYQVTYDNKRLTKFSDDDRVFDVDFYSQGEVESITNQAEPSRQLRLVDDFIRSNLQSRERTVAELESQLDSLETELTKLETELAEISIDINCLVELETRIVELEESLNSEEVKNHQICQDANAWLSNAVRHVTSEQQKLEALNFRPLERQQFTLQSQEAVKIFDALTDEIQATLELYIDAETKLQNESKLKHKQIAAVKANWDKQFESEKARYEQLLRQSGSPNLAALNEELSAKKLLRDDIVQYKKPRQDDLNRERARLLRQRTQTCTRLYQTWDGIRESRKFAAIELTKRLNNEVRIELSSSRNLVSYFDRLIDIAPGGTRKEVIESLIHSFTPSELVNVIRQRKVAELEAKHFSANAIDRLFSITECDLRKLERLKCEDIVTIQLQVGKVFKDLSSLSNGERCTAILSIILLDEHRPLVIDQPEDELDHDFIMSNVVRTLAGVKQKSDVCNSAFCPRQGRQFVIATHNQNIPVLGDAELVIRMKKVMDESRCEAICSHGMDHPDTIRQILALEGGKDAFDRRRERYCINEL